MRSRPGVSPLISAALYFGIVLAAVVIVLNVAFPTIERMQETAAIQNNLNFLADLDTTIREVAAEGRYSTRTTALRFGRGFYGFDNATDTLYYQIETDSAIISTHAVRRLGPLSLSANADVTVTNATVNGNDCYLMENDHMEVCIRNISRGGTVDTGDAVLKINNTETGRTFDADLETWIDGDTATTTGAGYTTAAEIGPNLGRGRVTLVNQDENYSVHYDLLSGADFLIVQAEGDGVGSTTTEIRMVLDDRATDAKWIDGAKRAEGVYTDDEVGFGYAVGETAAMAAGLVPGGDLQRLGFDNDTGAGRYAFNMTTDGASSTLVPFTEGDHFDIENREGLIQGSIFGQGNFLGYPSPNFAYDLTEQKQVRVALDYDALRLIGPDGRISPGQYTMVVRNEGIANGTVRVSVKVK